MTDAERALLFDLARAMTRMLHHASPPAPSAAMEIEARVQAVRQEQRDAADGGMR